MIRKNKAPKQTGTNPRPRRGTLRADERGQGLVEYALGLTLVALVATISVVAVGPAIKQAYCSALTVLDPEAGASCSSESGITVLHAKYNAGKKELDLQAKAPKDCEGDLQVQGYGAMARQGNSFVFKKTISTGSPPPSVMIGNDTCGWTSAPVH